MGYIIFLSATYIVDISKIRYRQSKLTSLPQNQWKIRAQGKMRYFSITEMEAGVS